MDNNPQSVVRDSMKFSISCFDVPEGLLDKSVSKDYFKRFGKLLKVRLRPKQKCCIVEYLDEESAVRALTESGDYDGASFRVAWSKQKSSEKKKVRKKAENWPIDSEIQAELDAMRGNYGPSRVFIEEVKKSAPKKPKSQPRSWKDKPKTSKQDNIITSEQDTDLLNTIMTTASTTEEKYRILDARDKLIRSRTVRKNELSVKTVGTCPDMCPEKERILREVQHQVASYEQLQSSKGMNHSLAVKQYSRSSADQEAPLPHELRPVKVLHLTMSYLLHKIMDLVDSSDVNISEWYHFLWDRTRGIRKDVTQQELCCLESVNLVEQCARFHVFCAARLVGEDVSVFDDKINTENLTKCLQTLKYMYHDLSRESVECPNESEFRAYVVLLNLNDGNFMWEVQQLDQKIQQSDAIKFAIKVYSALDKNNYVRFFKLVKSTTYLNACILLRYFNQVRYRALLTILKSYSPRQPNMQFPIQELYRILAFEDIETTIEFLEYYNLRLNSEKTHVILDRKMFRQPDLPFPQERAINVVESKRGCSVGEVVCGAPLPPKDFEKHTPHCSFDDNGYLKITELPKDLHSKYQEFLGIVSFQEENLQENLEEIEENEQKEEEIFEEPKKKTPSFSFEDKFNENSQPEVDKPDFAPKFDFPKPEPQINFWSKPQTFNFANTKNIFGTETTETSTKTQQTPATTIPVFKFTNPIVFTPKIETKPIEIVPEPVENSVDTFEEEERLRKEIEIKQRILQKLIEKEEREKKLRKERLILEELERKKLEREKQEKEQALKTEVKSVLNTLLNKVEEQLVKNRLSEISENVKKRRAIYFGKRWRHIARISRKKRKNFFDNPVWGSSKSAANAAEELLTPTQNYTLRDIKRYKRGVPDSLNLARQKSFDFIDVYSSVYRILFEKLNICGDIFNQNIFWKVCIDFEDNFHINKIMKDVFNWRENVKTEKRFANNGGSLAFCIKKLHQTDLNYFINGLIFIVDQHISDKLKNKLLNTVKIASKIPVVLLVNLNTSKNKIINELQLNNLLDHGFITTYNIVFYSDNNISSKLQQSLQFLASNVCQKSNLEMDALPVYLRHCIGEEFWFRIYNSCKMNKRLEILLKSPQIAIDLHNESLKKCSELIFNEEFLQEPNFANEFKQFVKQDQILLPCGFEHFPEYWNSKLYLNKVKKSVSCLYLPKFDQKWPPNDQFDLQTSLEHFCNKIFKDSSFVVLKLLSLLLDKIDLSSNFSSQMSEINWSSIIQLISLEKLSEMQFFDKTHAVYTVVYIFEDLKHFREFPWWYSTEIIKNRIRFVEIEEETEPQMIEVVEESEDEMDLDKTLAELDENDDEIKIHNDFKSLTNLLQDLEESMEIQKKIMNKFHEKVTSSFCK